MRAPRFDDQSVTLVVASYTTDSGLRSHEMTLDDFLARAALDGMKATRWFVHGVVVDRHGRVLGAADVLPSVAAAATTPELHLRARGIEAIGSETPDGFVVRAGSRAALTPVPSFPDYARKRREDLAKRGVLVLDGPVLRLTQDYVFESPSTAASVMLGRSANGRAEWKDAAGRPLRDLQEPAIDAG